MGAICYKKANFCDKPPKTVIANCKYKHFYQIMCKKSPFFAHYLIKVCKKRPFFPRPN